MIAVDVVAAQAELRHRSPRVPLFGPGAVPKGVSVPLRDDHCRRRGRKFVDGGGERRHPGAVAGDNDQVINVEGSRRTTCSLTPKHTGAIEFAAAGVRSSLAGVSCANWGLLAREQRDRKVEWEKLAAALDIFTELNMPRERDAVRADLEKMAAADRATCQTQSYLRIGQRYLRIALRARSASGLLDARGPFRDPPG